MKSSPLLLAFYKWWLSGEFHNDVRRNNRSGLCYNMSCYMLEKAYASGIEDFNEILRKGKELCVELQDQFVQAGLDRLYPFNKSQHDYDMESLKCACHENPARVKWVQDRIADMEEVE